MKIKRLIQSALLVSTTVFMLACGSDSKNSINPAICPLCQSGFIPISGSPQPNQEYVSAGTEVLIQFNESIDTTSIAGSMTIMQASSGQQPTDVTSQGQLGVRSRSSSNDSLVWVPTISLQPNVTYQVAISGNLRSAAGHVLGSPFSYRFYTGAQGGGPGVSVPGPPTVVSARLDTYAIWGCLAVNVTFNEDIVEFPIGDFRIEGAWYNLNQPIAQGPLFSWQPYPTNARIYEFEFGPESCDDYGYGVRPSWRHVGSKLQVHITEAVDLQNERMAAPFNRTFYGENVPY